MEEESDSLQSDSACLFRFQVGPVDDGVLGGCGVVGTADGAGVGRGVEDVGILGSLGSYAMHDVDEGVQRLLALGLRGLDHQGLVEEEGEVDRRGMEAEVEQALGDVERGGTLLALAGAVVDEPVEDELVLADAGDGQFVGVAQQLLDVVGVECSDGAYLAHVLTADGEQPGVGAQDDAEVAHVGANATSRLLGVNGSTSQHVNTLGAASRGARCLVVLLTLRMRIGQAVLEEGCDADGSAAGASAAVGRGERLVEVEVHDVETHVARADLAD